MTTRIRSYPICPDCGLLIRRGRLDVHKHCRPVPRAEGPTLIELHESPSDRLPIFLAIEAGAPCPCPTCQDQRTPEAP